jgi:UDP-glucose 4-epimerase
MTTATDEPKTDEDEAPTIGITGAAGYIGSRVVADIRSAHPEWNVIAIDNQYRGQVTSVGEVDIQHVDIRNRERLESALKGADVVCHLAAISGVDDCEENHDLGYEVNVVGTNNVAWFCRKTGAALSFPFSMAVLGDPETFPITVDHPRDPLNWYGRTKLLGERAIRSYAHGSFPAHLFLVSNLYGEHDIDGTRVSKPTVINFFASRVADDEALTVYEPGTQSRNFIHVKDVARVYVRSAERLLAQRDAGETGAQAYEVATTEDPSVMTVAERVAELAEEELGVSPEVKLVENPRGSSETLVEDFSVDISTTKADLGWEPQYSVDTSIRELLQH